MAEYEVMNDEFSLAVEQAKYCKEHGIRYSALYLPMFGSRRLPNDPGNGDDPDPEVGNVEVLGGEKAVACKIAGWNDAPPEKGGPYPIMGFYPSDRKEDVDRRVVFRDGAQASVYKEPIKSDGAQWWYMLVSGAEDGTELYLNAALVNPLW